MGDLLAANEELLDAIEMYTDLLEQNALEQAMAEKKVCFVVEVEVLFSLRLNSSYEL